MELSIVITILCQLLIAIGLFFFLRNYFPSYFKEKGKNLATKEDIAVITDKIEAVKNSYEKSLVKFSTFHNNQAEAIANLYKQLIMATDNLSRIDGYSDFDLSKNRDDINNFIDYFRQNRIYIEFELQSKITPIIGIMMSSYANFTQSRINEVDPKLRRIHIKTAYDKIIIEADPVLKALENEFRTLLSS